MGFLSALAKIGGFATKLLPIPGAGFIGDAVGAAGDALGAASQASASNRGTRMITGATCATWSASTIGGGEQNARARLTAADVSAIRQRAAAGLRYGDVSFIARGYGVTPSAVHQLLNGKTW